MAIQSLSDALYKGKRGQLAFGYGGKWWPLGDTDFVLTNTPGEKSERYTNEAAFKTLAISEVDQLDLKAKITFYQASKVALMMATISKEYPTDQPATVTQTLTFEDVNAGQELPLWKRAVKNVVVSDGSGDVVYVEGINYSVHAGEHGFGMVSIKSKPDGADDDVIVEFGNDAAKGTRYYFGSEAEIRGPLMFIEAVKPKDGRYPDTIYLEDVGFLPTGDWTRIGSDADYATIETEGTAYRNGDRPEGQQLGWLETGIQIAA